MQAITRHSSDEELLGGGARRNKVPKGKGKAAVVEGEHSKVWLPRPRVLLPAAAASKEVDALRSPWRQLQIRCHAALPAPLSRPMLPPLLRLSCSLPAARRRACSWCLMGRHP